MKKISMLLLGFLLFIGCAQSQIVRETSKNVEVRPQMNYPRGSPVDKYGKLKVAADKKGIRSLRNEKGNPVQLRGMSFNGLQWAGSSCVTAANVKLLAETFKCNILRVPVYVDEEGGFAYNQSHLNRPAPLKRSDGSFDWGYVEDVVTRCGENGIYCLIDWHVHQPGNPQHWKYRNRKYPEDLKGVDLAADFFTYCARRFQNQKHVLYEICNEPNGDVTWVRDIKPYCEDMLEIIRSYDKDAIVMCGSPLWSKNLEEIIAGGEPADKNGKKYENVMYTYHFYAASHNDGTAGENTNFMVKFQKAAARLPIFVSEWGTTQADGWTNFNPELSKKWLKIMNGDNDGNQMISWINWSFSGEGGACAMLKWNNGNIQSQLPEILTESGKLIKELLIEADKQHK